MFYAYTVHDVIEVEPVYLPKYQQLPATATAMVDTATAASSTGPVAGSSGHQLPVPQGEQTLVKTLFGSLEHLQRYLDQQQQQQQPRPGRQHHAGVGVRSGRSSGTEAGEEDDVYTVSIVDVVLHRLTEKYVGRVLPRCGLCVAIRDVLELSRAEIRGPSASAWVGVVFEVCVLAPAVDARLQGTILAHHPRGLYLSLIDLLTGTMSVFVDRSELLEGSRYDREGGVWYLPLDRDQHMVDANSSSNEKKSTEGSSGSRGEARSGRNYYNVGDPVLFKVLDTVVKDELAVHEAAAKREQHRLEEEGGGGNVGARVDGSADTDDALMLIRGSFLGDGLGPVAWFASPAEKA